MHGARTLEQALVEVVGAWHGRGGRAGGLLARARRQLHHRRALAVRRRKLRQHFRGAQLPYQPQLVSAVYYGPRQTMESQYVDARG